MDVPNLCGNIIVRPAGDAVRGVLSFVIQRQLGEQRVVADADRDNKAQLLPDRPLDLLGDGAFVAEQPVRSGHVKEGFIDGVDVQVFIRDEATEDRHDHAVHLQVERHRRLHNHKARVFRDLEVAGAGFDAEFLFHTG